MDIVTIGGGTGHSQVLKGLRTLRNIRITAVCPTTDSGGSTGQLIREYGGLGYLGDLTKCIAALCPDRRLARALTYRFTTGVFSGHSVKNMLLLGLEQTYGVEGALTAMHQLADITDHRVLPVATESTELRARLKLGTEISGETTIDTIAQNPLWHPDAHAITRIFLRPHVRAMKPVTDAIRSAGWIVVCPGDLYSSILPVLLPHGMKPAIKNSPAKIAIVLNIMTKKGETHGYHAEDFVVRIEEHLGRRCDAVLVNTAPIPRRSRLAYALERKVQLGSDAIRKDPRFHALPLVNVTPDGEVCHDEKKLARALAELIVVK